MARTKQTARGKAAAKAPAKKSTKRVTPATVKPLRAKPRYHHTTHAVRRFKQLLKGKAPPLLRMSVVKKMLAQLLANAGPKPKQMTGTAKWMLRRYVAGALVDLSRSAALACASQRHLQLLAAKNKGGSYIPTLTGDHIVLAAALATPTARAHLSRNQFIPSSSRFEPPKSK